LNLGALVAAATRAQRPIAKVAPLIDATTERADRLHAALSATFEGFYSVIEEANFERRVGLARD
jgi:hypothetical protein